MAESPPKVHEHTYTCDVCGLESYIRFDERVAGRKPGGWDVPDVIHCIAPGCTGFRRKNTKEGKS